MSSPFVDGCLVHPLRRPPYSRTAVNPTHSTNVRPALTRTLGALGCRPNPERYEVIHRRSTNIHPGEGRDLTCPYACARHWAARSWRWVSRPRPRPRRAPRSTTTTSTSPTPRRRRRSCASEITARRMLKHAEAFQMIADENGGNRASGFQGYGASVQYVLTKLRDAGYRADDAGLRLRHVRGDGGSGAP